MRYAGEGRDVTIRTNAETDGALLESVATPDAAERALLTAAVERMHLTAPDHQRVRRIARILADVAGTGAVGRLHTSVAIES